MSVDYKYDLQGVTALTHLPDTILTISAMSGGSVNEAQKQFYINTCYRVSEGMRTNEKDVGLRRTKGFSIRKGDIPNMIKTLQEIIDDTPASHYWVCDRCTSEKDQIVMHVKESSKDENICPKYGNGRKPQVPEKKAFVIE